MIVVVVVQGYVSYGFGERVGKGDNPELNATHLPGALFFSVLVAQIAPMASVSLFIYDRVFFSREYAAELYGSR